MIYVSCCFLVIDNHKIIKIEYSRDTSRFDLETTTKIYLFLDKKYDIYFPFPFLVKSYPFVYFCFASSGAVRLVYGSQHVCIYLEPVKRPTETTMTSSSRSGPFLAAHLPRSALWEFNVNR